MPRSREEYETHLRKITAAGLRYVVLWQEYERNITKDILDYYCGLNASGFIVANDGNAAFIKNYDKNILVICSVVQRVCIDILRRDLSNYDYVILYYPFNRSLDALKLLSPVKEKIVIMPNTLCNINCPSIHHWFPTTERPFVAERDCWMNLNTVDKCGLIFPEHLYLFDNYVGGYKLQGREYSTQTIKYVCQYYFNRKGATEFVEPFFRKDMAEKIKKLVRDMVPEKYYNTKTPEIIDEI